MNSHIFKKETYEIINIILCDLVSTTISPQPSHTWLWEHWQVNCYRSGEITHKSYYYVKEHLIIHLIGK